MILSRGEVSATLAKAARGQDMPLGHIDPFVAAAVCALADGARMAEITMALTGPHVTAQISGDTIANARVAMAGPVALDALACGADQIILMEPDAPHILQHMVLNANKISALQCVVQVDGTSMTLHKGDPQPRPKTTGPLNIPDPDWDIWCAMAAKTYVPATAASRLSGAGAGLTDND